MAAIVPEEGRYVPQIFKPGFNSFARWFLIVLPVAVIGSLFLIGAVNKSDFVSRADFYFDQPVPFSHRHHVSEVGIDCRYCHTTVETQASAFVPGPDTCMNCHSQIWKDSKMLQPIRDAYQEGRAVAWKRVNDLPDYVYFNHGIHIQKGVSCLECHGHMEDEALTAKQQRWEMQFCLNCHKHPEGRLRPREEIFNFVPAGHPDVTSEPAIQRELMKKYDVKNAVDCWRCHR